MFFSFGCSAKKDFAPFLANEIGVLGGQTNTLDLSRGLWGQWTVKRDKFGAAIDATGIEFEPITNFLSAAYGEPRYYSAANARHGIVYLYHRTNAGVSIFVSRTRSGAEVTLYKP